MDRSLEASMVFDVSMDGRTCWFVDIEEVERGKVGRDYVV
tara:strand:+ start:1623 stop:1742 length:120 start_codon:yes stop_codon:yes gene_type:complete